MKNANVETTDEIEDKRERLDDGDALGGVVRELGELGDGAVISEAGLARMFGRCSTTIKRAVSRGELPPPVRLLGGPAWTAGAIVRHLEARLVDAAKEADKTARKISQLRP